MLLVACAGPQDRLAPAEITADRAPVTRDTTIALLGGTGMVGGYLLREALAAGYPLRVLSRSPGRLDYLGDRVTVVQGDAREPAVIERLLRGADIVVTAIGPTGSEQMLSTAVSGNVVAAMKSLGIQRYIVVSGGAVVVPGDQRSFTGWWVRQLARLRYPSILRDKQAEYDVLAASGIDWTLVRCPLIAAEDYQREPRISLTTPTDFHLRAGELARFILEEVEVPQYRREGPFLGSR
ncbi:SDR family oxidoreductase [Parahaliea aestuarii]